MKRTIPTRVLEVLLVSLFLAAPCQAEEKPEKLWKGMGPINDKYDWLRPPDRALQAAITGTHSGHAVSKDFMYKYKKRIHFSSLCRVEQIVLCPPTASAASVAATDRAHFAEEPKLGAVKPFKNSLAVLVVVQTFDRSDLPNIAIMEDNKTVLPSKEELLASTKTACWDYEGISCWSVGRSFNFLFADHQRLSGLGYLVLRWHDVEKRIPVNFDYLW